MAWYDEAIFYHIYPLGMTGAPKQNFYGKPEHRLNTLLPLVSQIKKLGCNALYIGPLFESVGHGYETTDYKKLDTRLGTNEDLTEFVTECHKQGIRVILDGVFNHTGRDFFAFQDIKRNRESSPYIDWYCNVNFNGNNEYNDGFSYDNWGGYNLLVKLNQHNSEVREYISDVIRFWVKEFDIDGIRLDAADVLDFSYMQMMRRVANEVKPDFWLMGEVIHGDYIRWVNGDTLHSVTNYHLHKALYSGHNDHNYFEIAHTVKRLYEMGGNRADGLKLYNFADNHDVERIYTKLNNKKHFIPVHILLYTLPGVPSIYYGSEFGIEGEKQRGSDDSLRPAISYEQYMNATRKNNLTDLISLLGTIREEAKALSYGDYKELLLTNGQYAFARNYNGQSVLVTVNNGDDDFMMNLPAENAEEYVGGLSGVHVFVKDGNISVNVKANSGEIWLPAASSTKQCQPIKLSVNEEPAEILNPAKTVQITETVKAEEKKQSAKIKIDPGLKRNKSFEEMTVEELQEAILERMKRNGPVTEQMRKDVLENIYHNSLVTWIKSFN
ncbi:MAG: alpha-amylase [Clostridia bacterium]|nr:alpha-amylase [Clostridia bacterium]MBP3360225.1 alpha-amylase [Clostridia bacterium]